MWFGSYKQVVSRSNQTLLVSQIEVAVVIKISFERCREPGAPTRRMEKTLVFPPHRAWQLCGLGQPSTVHPLPNDANQMFLVHPSVRDLLVKKRWQIVEEEISLESETDTSVSFHLKASVGVVGPLR